VGSAAFRHWQLAEALDRGARMWRALAPGFRCWQGGREELPAVPDGGEELNAWYDRASLVFCHVHDPALGGAVYASESVDVACHEEAHAVLDALRPDLWDAASFEAAAFHEAFGDIGSLLVALEDRGVRAEAARESRGDPRASNLVSRLAEQLGRAARDLYGPDAASPGCLRDAANTFVYCAPLELPGSGPDSELTREPHSFSRVFSGAFYEAVARAARELKGVADGAALGHAARVLGGALARAASKAPVTSRFYAAVARAWLEAAGDQAPFAEALGATLAGRRLLVAGEWVPPAGPAQVCVRRADGTVTCFAAHPGGGEEAAAFLADLESHGRLADPDERFEAWAAGGTGRATVRGRHTRATHRIEQAGGRRTLRRIRIHGR
jgi:hypothetical protein